MEAIVPYHQINEALEDLDNGGRFYNFLSYADDGVITVSELGKLGGLFNEKQKSILFLALSIYHLEESEKQEIFSKFDETLQENYKKFKPTMLFPSEAFEKGVTSSNVIITGIPKLIESKTDFNGFVLVPILAGKAMTFVLIPLVDQYDVYHIFDETMSSSFLIAHSKTDIKLPETTITVGGVIKELKLKSDEISGKGKFLEINYYLS